MTKTLRSSQKKPTTPKKGGTSTKADTKPTPASAPNSKLRIPKLKKDKKRDGDSPLVSTPSSGIDEIKTPKKVSFAAKNQNSDGPETTGKAGKGKKSILKKTSKVKKPSGMEGEERGKKKSKEAKKNPKQDPSKVPAANEPSASEKPKASKQTDGKGKDSNSVKGEDNDNSDKKRAKSVMINKFSLNPEEQPKRSSSRVSRRKKKVSKQHSVDGADGDDDTEIVFNSKMTEEKLSLLQMSPLSKLISEKDKDAAAAEVYGEGATFADTVLRKRKRQVDDDQDAEIIYLDEDAEQAAKKQKSLQEENGRHKSLSASSKKLETRRLKRKIHELKRKGALTITEKETTDVGVVYLGHIPHGFYEKEIKGYFSQYGEVTRVRLSRSKKTARSRGFAFIEFADKEVAVAAAESMDGYLMHGRRLEAKLIEPERLHADTFKGANRTFRRIPFSTLERRGVIQRSRDPLKLSQRSRNVQKNMKRKKANLARRGIVYDFPLATPSTVTEPSTEKA